jgi:hypothetical protein
MKTLIGALALLMAAPVGAQTAPAADAQAEHSQHQHPSGAPSEHKMDCKCCDEAKMKDCCDHAEHSAEHGGHSSK